MTSALLLLSGGIDSVQALHARCVAGERTRTHFVHLRNWENRSGHESRAVRDVLHWFHENGFGDLITHTESAFDYGDLRYIVRDHNSHGLWAAIILADPRNEHIAQVVRTFHRDSVRGGLDSPAGRAAERGWREPIDRLTAKREHPVELVYPQIAMTKADIMGALPPDLLKLCWYCRRPRGGACHECHTCKQVDAALAGSPLPPLADLLPAGVIHASPPTLDRPAPYATRKAWAAYAQEAGLDVEGLTKAQIIERVG